MKPGVLAVLLFCGSVWAAPPKVSVEESALRQALFTRTANDGRTYGSGDLDILFWDNTEHLLTQPSHAQALAALDAFIAKHGEITIQDPSRRVWLQRDLWQLFDWSHRTTQDDLGQRAALRTRLAAVIRRLALTEQQIQKLEGNLPATSRLPGGEGFPLALDGSGEWVVVARAKEDLPALAHVSDFGGRSVFLVMLRLPGGRKQTLAYLEQLRGFVEREGSARASTGLLDVNFPANTRWALARTLNVVDNRGRMRTTRLVESVQMRTYTDPTRQLMPRIQREAPDWPQTFAELQVDREQVPELRLVRRGERQFNPNFMSQGIDPFEMSLRNTVIGPDDPDRSRDEVLTSCGRCHHAPGVQSVNSIHDLFERRVQFLEPVTFDRVAAVVATWKESQTDWIELRRLWTAGQ